MKAPLCPLCGSITISCTFEDPCEEYYEFNCITCDKYTASNNKTHKKHEIRVIDKYRIEISFFDKIINIYDEETYWSSQKCYGSFPYKKFPDLSSKEEIENWMLM